MTNTQNSKILTRAGGKLYVVYLDWFSAFTSVSLHKMYYLMERMGMHADDIEICCRLRDINAINHVVWTPGCWLGARVLPELQLDVSVFLNLGISGVKMK